MDFIQGDATALGDYFTALRLEHFLTKLLTCYLVVIIGYYTSINLTVILTWYIPQEEVHVFLTTPTTKAKI